MNFGNRSGGGVGLKETGAMTLVGIFALWPLPTAIVVTVVAAIYWGAGRIRLKQRRSDRRGVHTLHRELRARRADQSLGGRVYAALRHDRE